MDVAPQGVMIYGRSILSLTIRCIWHFWRRVLQLRCVPLGFFHTFWCGCYIFGGVFAYGRCSYIFLCISHLWSILLHIWRHFSSWGVISHWLMISTYLKELLRALRCISSLRTPFGLMARYFMHFYIFGGIFHLWGGLWGKDTLSEACYTYLEAYLTINMVNVDP